MPTPIIAVPTTANTTASAIFALTDRPPETGAGLDGRLVTVGDAKRGDWDVAAEDVDGGIKIEELNILIRNYALLWIGQHT